MKIQLEAGGGIELEESNSLIKNCLITGNRTYWSYSSDGGGIVCGGNVVLINCTIYRNRVINGGSGGISIRGRRGDKVIMKNCIVWGNSASFTCNQISNPPSLSITGSALLEIINCTIQDPNVEPHCLLHYEGSWSTADPCFVDPGYWDPYEPNNAPMGFIDYLWVEGDYHLKSQAGRWDPVSRSWVIDDVTSPCIDAGDPSSPVGDEPFPNGGIINMGAYGGTSEASKSYFDGPLCETIIAGDINGDCKVDLKDLALLSSHWLENRN